MSGNRAANNGHTNDFLTIRRSNRKFVASNFSMVSVVLLHISISLFQCHGYNFKHNFIPPLTG